VASGLAEAMEVKPTPTDKSKTQTKAAKVIPMPKNLVPFIFVTSFFLSVL
jgi:hypothetical protein